MVLATLLGVYNVLRSWVVPDDAHFVLNVGVGLTVIAAAGAIGLDHRDVGLGWEHLADGLRVGALAFACVALIVAIAVSPLSPLTVTDDRVDISSGELLLRAAIVIPVGTVLFEELLFRGVLHNLLRSQLDLMHATVIGAAFFGAWHLAPVWFRYTDAGIFDPERLAALAGTFVATFTAGLGFLWLRHRAQHLAAPILAHTATNSATLVLVWSASQ